MGGGGGLGGGGERVLITNVCNKDEAQECSSSHKKYL